MEPFVEKKIVKILENVATFFGLAAFMCLLIALFQTIFIAVFLFDIAVCGVLLIAARLLSERKEWETRFLEYIESMYKSDAYKGEGDNLKNFVTRNEFIVHEIERLAIKDGLYTIENPVLSRTKMIHTGCLNMNSVLKKSTDIIEIERKRYEGIH